MPTYTFVQDNSRIQKSDYDCRPYRSGNWVLRRDVLKAYEDLYIMINAFRSFSGVSLFFIAITIFKSDKSFI